MTKWVYTFGDGKAEGNAGMRNLLGGKGANLAEMSSIGCPVPPGFTITTEACTYYYQNNKSYADELKQQVNKLNCFRYLYKHLRGLFVLHCLKIFLFLWVL